MTGEQLLREVVATIQADYPALRWFHSYDPIADKLPGLPDLIIAGKGGLVFRECKGADEELSRAQTAWKWQLLAAGADWSVWRPRDWPVRIRAELEALHG